MAESGQDGALPDVGPLGYEPMHGVWICDWHGVADCEQTEHCRALPWRATEDPALDEFRFWAQDKFAAIIRPYDAGEVAEIPDGAFDAYFPADWLAPVADDAADTEVLGYRYRNSSVNHTDGIADSGVGYTVRTRVAVISCQWCEWHAVAETRADALLLYRAHERSALDAEAAAHD